MTGRAPDEAKRGGARDVADWMAARLGRPVATQRGWDYLQRLKHRQHVPRPRHALAASEQQADFKKKEGPCCRRLPPGSRRCRFGCGCRIGKRVVWKRWCGR